MALADAVIGIAEQMEEEAADLKGDRALDMFLSMTLKGWARALRSAVAAARGTEQHQGAQLMDPHVQDAVMIARAREEIREKKQKAGFHEDYEQEMVEVRLPKGETPLFLPVPPGLPADGSARTEVNGMVYRLVCDETGKRWLEPSAEDTERVKRQLGERK